MPENCASSCRAPCSTPGTVGQLLGCPGTRRCAGGAAGRPTCQVGTGEPASTIQISFDLPVECSLICSKGAEGVGSIGGGHRTREGKRRASGRTRGGPVKKRCVGIFGICFFGIFGENQGRPCQEGGVCCVGVFGLLCNKF